MVIKKRFSDLLDMRQLKIPKQVTKLLGQQVKKTNHSLRAWIKNRYALHNVVGTLIILVIAVLLASVVTYFAINVVSTRVQDESLSLMKQHIWVNSTATAGSMAYSEAALMIVNTGGRDAVLQKLAVRGQNVEWNNTDETWNSRNPDEKQEAVLYCVTKNPIAQDMPYVDNFNVTRTNQVTFGKLNCNFRVASSPLSLKSGYTMLIYVVNPDSLTVNDIGLTASITVYSAQAMYYVESNVQTVAP